MYVVVLRQEFSGQNCNMELANSPAENVTMFDGCEQL
jgi:hypothetical protein